METQISLKKEWISTDAWRGFYRPINAVCGANDTGTWSDSPCPSNVRAEELRRAKKILRANNIPCKQSVCRSSNCFCVHVYLCVPPEDKDRAIGLLKPLEHDTKLFYIV